MGHMGDPDHPEVINAINTYVNKAKTTGVNFSLAGGGDAKTLIEHIDRGVDWLTIGLDFMLMLNKAEDFTHPVHEYLKGRKKS